MNKNKIIFCSFLMGVLLHAQSVESVLGINVGMTSTKNDSGAKFENPTIGVTYQDSSYVIMPRVDLDYVKLKNEEATSLLKGSINGVYEFENSTNTTPYALAGVGYEYVSGETKNVFESHPFVQGGVGANFLLKNDFKINIESKMLQIIGGENEENEVILTAGVSFPLSYKKEKTISHIVTKPIILEPIIKPMYINNNECSIKIDLPDLDRDGVEDKIDQCPATPCNFSVDNYGCPIKATLKINFATNSATITRESLYRVDRFAKFLLNNKGSMVNIVGHTDNVGEEIDNMTLSIKRAESVRNALIQRGVSPARLRSEGKGESMPIASNRTEQGRAMNRRIEAELSYPKGRR